MTLLSAFAADQLDKFLCRRHAPRFLLRVDLFTIEENIQGARPAGTHPHRNIELAFHGVFEAHGLSLNIASKEAASNLDAHA